MAEGTRGKRRKRRGGGPRSAAAAAVSLIASVVVLLGGTGLIVYGAAFHAQPVLMEQKVQIPGLGLPSDLFPPVPGEAPLGLPEMVETITLEETEPRLVLEVSRGGVARTELGEIKRTYSGKPPSACPT
jgi:hypothetical protein